MGKARLVYDGNECRHYIVGKYRVTTYPGSSLVYIVLAAKTHKRVVGRHVEAMCRDAISEHTT